MTILALFLCLLGAEPVAAEPADAATWLDRSIAHHFPNNSWAGFSQQLEMEETRPNGPTRMSTIVIDLPGKRFYNKATTQDTTVVREEVDGKCTAQLNGSADFTEEEAEKHRLTCERIVWMRDYYTYMWGLPAKLKDPGTVLDPNAVMGEFMGETVVVLGVSYAPEVGVDKWEFYLNPETAALVGCRFWKQDRNADGEYLIFEEEYQLGEMRLPNKRSWITNKDGELLGVDTVTAHKALK